MTSNTKPYPTTGLMGLVVTLLAPMFFYISGNNIDLARMAAAETINDYRARNHVDLLAVAQIIACGLASIASISLSMEDSVAIPLMLRLRGNACALIRSGELARRVL